MGTEGVSKVMMIGGGTLGFLGVGGVAYTRGSVGTRWILSVHIGFALSWRHWTCGLARTRSISVLSGTDRNGKTVNVAYDISVYLS